MDALDFMGRLKAKELIALYNKYSPNPVRKFSDAHTAQKRVAKILEDNNITIEQVALEDIISPETREKLTRAVEKEKAKKDKPPKTPKAPSSNKKDYTPGPRTQYNTMRIYKIIQDSPYQKGSSREGSFARITNGMTYAEYRKLGGKTIDLRFGVAKGHLELKSE